MNSTVQDVLEFVADNDVKFIRLAFCDIMGALKNISIMPDELPRAFTTGISFDASSILGFGTVESSDLFLFPDAATLSVLPWRPQQGRVVRFFCNIKTADGQPYAADGRHLLRQAISRLSQEGYECRIGAECEFYLFERDEKGNPTHIPQDKGGYLDVAPWDKGENIRREICLTLEEMNIRPESSHHEQGPGQNEIDFRYANALSAADDVITFKNVVQTAAFRSGLCASFDPKPLPSKPGSGMHVNISLLQEGKNLFSDQSDNPSTLRQSFLAGLLAYAPQLCAFANPVPQSYRRFGAFEAPSHITWGHHNRGSLVRIPAVASEEFARLEMRMPDACCNPYHVFALLLTAGLRGIQQKLEPMAESKAGIDCTPAALPADLGAALELAKSSELVQEVLGSETAGKYLSYKEKEYKAYMEASDKERYLTETYFGLL
ncbi:MAG: glutamine synthetase family protein [Angelakisella sp.]|nr:glutamine synthetase family protein [Angelakisella sp.]